MIRIGILLAVLGFGSAGLHYTDYQFRLLSWSEDMQPLLGLGVGALGVVLIVAALLLKKNKENQPAEQFPQPEPNAQYNQYNQQPGQPPYPQQPQYGQPPRGYPQQDPNSAPQGFPAQQPGYPPRNQPPHNFGPQTGRF
ncbi:hypothetical protein [Amycolatopsis anabasis]|uniref:hypothetical protein n=1 Tax=Amycolatopsis anabasis TaxID=1840409 RepID=UPI001FE4B6FD|nr:hypothetical protein [Amycolatopsis anabasis]